MSVEIALIDEEIDQIGERTAEKVYATAVVPQRWLQECEHVADEADDTEREEYQRHVDQNVLFQLLKVIDD